MAPQYGLIGWPLGHSFSQKFFGELFGRDGSGRSYANFPIQELSAESLRLLLDENPHLEGLNVTAPHKITAAGLVDSLDDLSAAVGAVNTIKIYRDSHGKVLRTKGFNTDVAGLAQALRPLLHGTAPRALILGTGGASRAAVVACRSLGIEVATVSRTPGKGALTYADLDSAVMASHKLIINATPLGTYPDTGSCAHLPYHLAGPEHICFDMVYNPPETEFMRRSLRHGATVSNGLAMLHAQALASLHIWETDT